MMNYHSQKGFPYYYYVMELRCMEIGMRELHPARRNNDDDTIPTAEEQSAI